MSLSITSPVTISGAAFTGVSKFAPSLQQVLSRAESIAALPLQSLQAQLTTSENQQSALQGVDTAFANLQNSVSALVTAAQSSLLSSSVSDTNILSANVRSGATPGTYTVQVNNLGSYSTAISVAGQSTISDPSTQGLDGSTTYTLTAAGETTTITANSASLNDLVTAINTQAGGQVQASIVNVGSTGSPDYRLSLQASSLGPDPVDLSDANGDLISSASPGSVATYQIDGLSSVLTSTSRSLALAPGLSVTLLGESNAGRPVTVTVGNDSSGLESAFSAFATAYNNAQTALSQQRGQGGGALEGDSLVYQLGSLLNQLGTYGNGTPEQSLAAFGVTLDQTGQISVDSTAFSSAASNNFSNLLSMLGSPTSGGFLEAATNALNAAEDPTTGVIKTEESSLSSEITAQGTKINDEQNTLTQLNNSLTAQISSADSTIAELESRVTYVTGLFAQYTGNNTSNSSNGLPTL